MALGDKVIVAYDDGGRTTQQKEVRVGSAGGNVDWARVAGFVEVVESTRSGAIRRKLAFREERVVSVEYEPSR